MKVRRWTADIAEKEMPAIQENVFIGELVYMRLSDFGPADFVVD